ncbi:LysR substrate-binding domain-containing protein [Roseibium sediminis]|uniref:LysR substrate-binding domain-containing protein n=1 Tax=Roseibium sediminis TaxID=1775174 RepID=UPI00123CD0CF|nr:LysR substrate-binding domain-containing protein [Roseibium sediminis]
MRQLDAVTLKQLKALKSIYNAGTISGAAEDLGLTSPAVHNQIRTLEDCLGCSLLERGRNGLFNLTPEGSALLSGYEAAFASLEKAVHQIESLKRGLSGTVILGVVSTGKYFAPGIVARMKALFPDIEVVLEVGNRDAIIAALETGRIDLAIMGRPPRQPVVTAYPIGDHPHLLIAPPDHRLVTGADVAADEIFREHFLLRERGSGTRILTMRFLDQSGEGIPFEYSEMNSNETIKQAVIAGLGIALISYHTIIEELKSGRLAAIRAEHLPIIRQWYVLHRSDQTLSGAMATILSCIRSKAEEFLHIEDLSLLLNGKGKIQGG